MAHHTDIPSRDQIVALLEHRSAPSVSIYMPTSPLPQKGHAESVTLSNLAEEALAQLRADGADSDDIEALDRLISDLTEDEDFWKRQSDSLVVFATPERLQTFRLPNRLSEAVEVSDRFHLKPLFRAVTFPQAAYVLALARGAVRLLEISPDAAPVEVPVPEMPDDAWDPRGNRVFMARDRNYVRSVDHALRNVLTGSDLPLILAATETIDALYRTVNSYPHLVETRWPGNAEEVTDAELADDARTILDAYYAEQLAELTELFDTRSSQGRTATDVSDIARLATLGAVDTVFLDIDESLSGSIDEQSGAVKFADGDSASTYGVVDEIARRVHLASGRVLAVRAAEVPGGGPVAAILRYAI